MPECSSRLSLVLKALIPGPIFKMERGLNQLRREDSQRGIQKNVDPSGVLLGPTADVFLGEDQILHPGVV